MVRLEKGSDRNTQAYNVYLGSFTLHFSYETCIAIRTPYGAFRIPNMWGPTTGRHFKEMRCDKYIMVEDQEEFNTAINSIGWDSGCDMSTIQAFASKHNPNYQKPV